MTDCFGQALILHGVLATCSTLFDPPEIKTGLLSIVNIPFILIILCQWYVIPLKGSEIAHINVV